MTKNITLSLDESILRVAKKMAFDQNVSLSQWVVQLISRMVHKKSSFQLAKKRACELLSHGFDLGGVPLARGQIYER